MIKKRVDKAVGKTIYLPKELIEQTKKLDFYMKECRSNFSIYVEVALREKNKRVKKVGK